MPLTLPHTFVDGPGNTASGEEVMDNLNAVNAGVAMATVTSLPSSPVNGQECYYLADATNGVVWHLKYRTASASAYKWEFVGGDDLLSKVTATESPGSTGAWVNLTTTGPDVTVPLAGDYEVSFGGVMVANASTNQFGVAIGSTTPSSVIGTVSAPAATAIFHSASLTDRLLALVAANVLRLRYNVSATAGSQSFGNRWLRVRPVRVG